MGSFRVIKTDIDFISTHLHNLGITEYIMIQSNGQRIFKRKDEPSIPSPPKGSEIFVGKLPRDYFEDEIIPLFATIGPIYKVRLMVDFSGKSRGYAFVTYFTVADANAAIAAYNHYEIRRGCKIGVYKSVDNCRLFVGNLPKDKSKKEIIEGLLPYAEGLRNVILYKSLEDPTQNRGFAFLEFTEHRAAAMTRRKLAPGTFVLWDHSILVDWADPLPDVDPGIMSRVKKLYVRNLDLDMTTEDLRILLCDILSTQSHHMVKVYKTMDYAFIHFASRSAAETALMVILERIAMLGPEVEVTWARPKIYSKENRLSLLPETYCKSLPPQARRMVQMRQELTRIRNGNNVQPSELRQYQSRTMMRAENTDINCRRFSPNGNAGIEAHDINCNCLRM